jgi:hypothetical protein
MKNRDRFLWYRSHCQTDFPELNEYPIVDEEDKN